jgi:hypothetical protein
VRLLILSITPDVNGFSSKFWIWKKNGSENVRQQRRKREKSSLKFSLCSTNDGERWKTLSLRGSLVYIQSSLVCKHCTYIRTVAVVKHHDIQAYTWRWGEAPHTHSGPRMGNPVANRQCGVTANISATCHTKRLSNFALIIYFFDWTNLFHYLRLMAVVSSQNLHVLKKLVQTVHLIFFFSWAT